MNLAIHCAYGMFHTEIGVHVAVQEKTDLVDGLYMVAMQPERFRELADIWTHYLKEIGPHDQLVADADFKSLQNHLSRAEAIVTMVEANPGILPAYLQQKIDQDPQAVAALDERGQIQAVNAAGASLLGLKQGAQISDQTLGTDAYGIISAEIKARFSEAGHAVARGQTLHRIVLDGEDAPLLMSFSDWRPESGPHLVLMKTASFIWPSKLNPVIRKAFGLTGAETDIVKLLVEGSSVQDVADARQSKLSTVRAQIRSIYAKTSTRNQTEFMRMAIGLTTMQRIEGEGAVAYHDTGLIDMPLAYPRVEHEHLLTLPDGRLLDYAVFGAADGKPCLFFHNELLGNIWPAKMAEYAAAKGLRVIVPARPYYGKSDPYPPAPRQYDNPTQTARDFTALLDHLNIDKAVLLGQTLGGMFALAMARDFPQRVAGLVAISPLLPSSRSTHTTRMPKMHRFVSTLLMRQPKLLEFIARAGNSYYRRVGPVRFMEHAFGDLDCDVHILQDPVNQEAIVRALQFGQRHGHRGYVAGFSHMMYDADSVMRDLPFPVFGIIGDCDKNTRAARAKALQKKGVDFNIVSAKGGGELLIYSHPRLIIDTVLTAWDAQTAVAEQQA